MWTCRIESSKVQYRIVLSLFRYKTISYGFDRAFVCKAKRKIVEVSFSYLKGSALNIYHLQINFFWQPLVAREQGMVAKYNEWLRERLVAGFFESWNMYWCRDLEIIGFLEGYLKTLLVYIWGRPFNNFNLEFNPWTATMALQGRRSKVMLIRKGFISFRALIFLLDLFP